MVVITLWSELNRGQLPERYSYQEVGSDIMHSLEYLTLSHQKGSRYFNEFCQAHSENYMPVSTFRLQNLSNHGRKLEMPHPPVRCVLRS